MSITVRKPDRGFLARNLWPPHTDLGQDINLHIMGDRTECVRLSQLVPDLLAGIDMEHAS